MRYTQPLDDVLSSRAKLRALRYLCTAGGEHTGREIARAIGMGETATNLALRELADMLIVLYRVAGRSHRYRLNERHALVQRVLHPLFAAEQAQCDAAVAELLTDVDVPLDSALVYGSVARGDDTWDSDLDILLITPTSESAQSLSSRIWRQDGDLMERYGPVSVRILSRDEFVARVRRGEGWVKQALEESLLVRGTDPRDLLHEVEEACYDAVHAMMLVKDVAQEEGLDGRLLHLTATERAALTAFVNRLRQCYGDDVLHVTLFGSKARGDSGDESDLDLLVVMRMEDGDYRKYWNEIVDIAWDIELAYDVVTSLVIKDEVGYAKMRDHQLLLARNIERDGIELWTRQPSVPTSRAAWPEPMTIW